MLHKYSSHGLIACCLISALLAGSLMQHTTFWPYGVALSFALTLLVYLCYTDGTSLAKLNIGLALVIALYLFSVAKSLYVSRSTMIAMNVVCAFFIFCAFSDQKAIGRRTRDAASGQFVFSKYVRFSFAAIIFLHSLLLIVQYVDSPIRTTGFFKDYSHAAMGILLVYGLIYPDLKKHKAYIPLTLVFFLAFFTPFSRTANFLLIPFICAVFFWEQQRGSLHSAVKLLLTVLVALALVYIYPLLIEQPIVDRGGLTAENLSTLNSRMTYWSAAWEAIIKNPFWGYGLGNFEWSGIKLKIPFEYIPSVHNDYLQIWLDLGIVWLALMIGLQGYVLIKSSPYELKWRFSLKSGVSEYSYTCWVLLICVFAYMVINFIISFLFFQLLIVFMISEVLNNEQS